MPSPKLVPLVLSDAERASLEALSRKRTVSQSLAERARVVLACADESGVAPLTLIKNCTHHESSNRADLSCFPVSSQAPDHPSVLSL